MPPALATKSSKNKSAEQAQKHPAEVSRQPVPTSPHGAVLALQRSAGNHAVNHLLGSGLSTSPSTGGAVLQRKCACGANTMAGGECEECSKNKRLGLQTKLQVNEPGDIYEQQADRIADQVMAKPAHRALIGAPPRIQRLAGQPTGQADAAPASVNQALASPGRPLEPALRRDMEQRFGHDFSRVRVHSGAAAEQSAQDVNAHAYTVGHHIVFGAGRFAPEAHDGQRLLAHELTHVVLQSKEDKQPPWVLRRQKRVNPIRNPKVVIYQSHWLAGDYFKSLADKKAREIKALKIDTETSHCPEHPTTGSAPYNTGADIVDIIKNAYECTGSPVKQIHIYSHGGPGGVYDTSGQILTQRGLYGEEGVIWPIEREQGGRTVHDIPRDALAGDVIFVIYGCDTDQFAEKILQAILGTSPRARVYGRPISGRAGRPEHWTEYSARHPYGKYRRRIPY